MAIEGSWLLKVETADGNLWASIQAATSMEALFRLVQVLEMVPSVGGRVPELKGIRYMQREPGLGEAASLTITNQNGDVRTRSNQMAFDLLGMHAQWDVETTLQQALHNGSAE